MYSPPQVAWYLARNRRQRRAASLVIDGTPVETSTNGVAYAGFTVTASGGQSPYAYSGWGLPSGITVDASTGEVAGTPTESGVFDVTIRAADIQGNTADLFFTLTVS